jgi:hypothetical protein
MSRLDTRTLPDRALLLNPFTREALEVMVPRRGDRASEHCLLWDSAAAPHGRRRRRHAVRGLRQGGRRRLSCDAALRRVPRGVVMRVPAGALARRPQARLVGCTDRTGPDWTGLDWTGLDWTGLDWTGLDWTGLDWTGLDWTGLDWTGLDWTGLDWTGLD